jgi:hypothetical protein
MKKSILVAVFAAFLGIKAVKSFVIDCTFREVENLFLGIVYECDTHSLPQSSTNPSITGVTGTHIEGKTDADVTSIFIRGNITLSFVPRVGSVFPNLIAYLLWDPVGFDTLHGDEFDDLPRLEYLDIYRSKLTTISSRLFEATPNIVFVDLQGNTIERVGHDLFTPLNTTQLQVVYFNDNRCIDQRGNSQAEIISLIENLRVQCPFDDEVLPSTTTTTITEPETCVNGSIFDFVCELSESVDERLKQADLRHERALNVLRKDFEKTTSELQEELSWMREELLRLTTNPCACM